MPLLVTATLAGKAEKLWSESEQTEESEREKKKRHSNETPE